MREISKEQLEERIKSFEDKGYEPMVKNDSFNFYVETHKKEGRTWRIWTLSDVEDMQRDLGFLIDEARDAKRYINLIKIHYSKYPEEWKAVS